MVMKDYFVRSGEDVVTWVKATTLCENSLGLSTLKLHIVLLLGSFVVRRR